MLSDCQCCDCDSVVALQKGPQHDKGICCGLIGVQREHANHLGSPLEHVPSGEVRTGQASHCVTLRWFEVVTRHSWPPRRTRDLIISEPAEMFRALGAWRQIRCFGDEDRGSVMDVLRCAQVQVNEDA